MSTKRVKALLRKAFVAALMFGAGLASAATTVNLTAQRATALLPDGAAVPMWQLCGGLAATATNAGTTAGGACPATAPGAWAPGPTITVPAGDTLTINLTNHLTVPTSIVVLGQLGGGLGQGTRMASPPHPAQNFSTFVGNAPAGPFTPPAQGTRVESFGTEIAAGASGALCWGPGCAVPTTLRPGTYLYETGTLPSLQAPMGLYGLLIVTRAPVAATATTAFAPGDAYPPPTAGAPARVPYDADVALLFSEIDPVQNAQVDKAAQAGTSMSANLRFNDPACTPNCYPAAVNYTPTYFLINGQAYDATQPALSSYAAGGAFSTGRLLLRLANAGSHTHTPALPGLGMALAAEDGNLAPGNPKVQNEALLTAGKTYDAVITPASAAGAYAPASFPIFDRTGDLSNASQPNGGMRGYLLVNGGTAPAALTPMAVNDAFSVPLSTAINGNVRLNDILVRNVALLGGPAHGTLALNADGSFIYTPTAGYSGVDTFTYAGNLTAAGGTTTNTATVTLTVGAPGVPVANNDSFTSAVASVFTASGPGILANDTDPAHFALAVDPATVVNGGCASLTVNADGSFTATSGGAASCSFSYNVRNSQGVAAAAPATVTVSFPTGTGLALNVVDAAKGTPITDYRWVIQEDLTFKHDPAATPPVGTRTIGTSFHRSYHPVIASGCTGPVSCGDGQKSLGTALPAAPASSVADVLFDKTRRYYVSVLPGDAQNPVINGGGAPVATGQVDAKGNPVMRPFDVSKDCSATPNDPKDPCGHTMSGTEVGPAQFAALSATVKLQKTPLVPAQMSIFIYEDNNPTNGQNDLNENGLGGFNIVLWDPAGRTGDPAGQQTYDAFNMPLTNALLGTPGCPDDQNPNANGTGTSAAGNLVGVVYTCPNAPNPLPPGRTAADYSLAGHALIKNITPARYDVIAHPAAAREGAGEVWWQTETLEGTPAQDAFTGINEPRYFQEFGPPGFHTTIGFVNPQHIKDYAAANHLTGTYTITGKVTNQHMSRPSNVTLYDSGSYDLLSSTVCQVALNSQGGTGATIAIAQCRPDGSFTLSNVPAGSYELAVWDQWLDQIIQTQAVTVGATPTSPATVALGNIPVLSWFTQHDQYELLDGSNTCDVSTPASIALCNLTGVPNVLMTMRYRNGAISNQTLTDTSGNGILVELFPLFNWYVTESDTTRFKQKAVNITVDGGGATDATGPGAGLWTSKYATGESSVRNEVPGAYSYGNQGFISERNQIKWIKAPYAKNENGGVQGTVVLASTRPFDDQRFDIQNIWEPLIPRVTVNLYRRVRQADGTVTLSLVDTTLTSSWDDWVNTVYGADGKQYILGSDQVLRDPVTGAPAPGTPGVAGGAYPPGKQVNIQCPGQLPGATGPAPWDTTKVDPFTNYTLLGDQYRCYDGFHNWNQVQSAPYDGRYQFPSAAYIAAHPLTAAQAAAGQTLVSLPTGDYVVEAVTPPGFEIVKEQDKDILIGDAFIAPVNQQFGALASIFILPDQATLNNANPNNPGTGDFITANTGTVGNVPVQSNPTTNLGVAGAPVSMPECVGALHRVPDYLSLFPQARQVAPFAGMDRPLCDKKLVKLGDQMQATANFFVFTPAPMAANSTGIILDDASSEFNAVAPDFGEKASVPFVPVSTKDFAGHEISRAYSDQWGAYNMMLPSSWLVNPPTPSGYGPNMLVTCINDPGPIPATNALGQWIDANGVVVTDPALAKQITDPAYNPAYSNFCYTNPFMPGQATYLDTPVLPIAAFAAGYNPTDCAYPDATPGIARVDSSAGFGPYLPAGGGTLTIKALGFNGTTDVGVDVPNPAYSGPFALSGPAAQKTVTRHYGFGAQGAGSGVTIGGVVMPVAGWSNDTITVNVPAGTPTGELVVTAANGKSSIDAVTVTVGGSAPIRVPGNYATIQAAIDNAVPGDLILVDAGTYNELVIMWKPVRLQGVGAASVIINAAKYPTSKLEQWRPMINALFGIDTVTGNPAPLAQVDPLPGQEITGGVVLLEPSVLGTEEGAGITVLAKGFKADGVTPLTASAADCAYTSTTVAFDLVNGANTQPQPGLSNFLCAPSRIDGLSITGGDAGGGIYVNGWAHDLEIANNRVYGNAGALNGGIRVGVPYLEVPGYPGQLETAAGTLGGSPTVIGGQIAGFGYDRNVRIHHNAITKNGVVEGTTGQGGAGGGVSVCTGSDGYSVDHNWICGNYTQSDGGGIGHLGFSQGGTIAFNQILFNQSFQQTTSTHGGGIMVAGEPALALQTLSLGTGNVTIDANVIRGNFAESGKGGGIRLQQVNGADVQAFPGNFGLWSTVSVTNNIVSNNVAAWTGGGISMSDVLDTSRVINNTVASNDSTGTAGVLLAGTGETATSTGTGRPGPAGIASEPTSPQLLNAISTTATYPVRVANQIANPILENNILWHNRSFFYTVLATGAPALCSSNGNLAGCTQLPAQTTTGQCTGTPSYWDLGSDSDASVTPSANANLRLHPVYSVLTSSAGYGGNGATHNANTDPRLLDLYCNGSRVTPEFGTVLNPPAVLAMQAMPTVDEGNNYVNVRYGPLTLSKPTSGAGTAYAAFGDYHIAAASPAVNTGSSELAPNHDVDGQARPQGIAFDKGADEVPMAGSAGLISVAPTQVNFGNEQVGAPSAFYPPQTVTVTNNGNATLPGIALSLTGGAGNFALVNNGCTAALAAGTSCTFGVAFVPTAYVTRTATVNVNSTGNPTQQVALTGTGAHPAQSVAPVALTFTSQLINTTSAAQPVVVTNTGVGPLTVTGIGFAGTGAARFSQTNDCLAAAVPVGGSCTINVAFTPTATGTLAPTMRITFAAATLPSTLQVVTLSGTGTVPTVTQSPLAFGTVPPGDPTLTAQLNNGAGAGNLTVTGVSITSGAAYFVIAPNSTCTAGATVLPGNNCDVNVTFTQVPATSTANRTGNLRIITSGGIFNVPLSGN